MTSSGWIPGPARFAWASRMAEETDLEACKASGISQEMVDFVSLELERVGRGKPEGLKVAFEFDSDENVAANFEGNYFLRLR